MKKRMIFYTLILLVSCLLFSPAGTVSAEEEKTEITHIYNAGLFTKALLFTCGDENALETELSYIPDYFCIFGATNDDMSKEAALTLDTYEHNIDIHTPGEYKITITLKLLEEFEDEFFISDSNRTLIIPVYITDPDAFTIYYTTTTTAFVEYQWTKKPWEGDIQAEYLAVTPGTTFSDAELACKDWTVCTDDSMAAHSTELLRIFPGSLDDSSNYYFRVRIGDHISNAVFIKLSDPPKTNGDDDGQGGSRDNSDYEEDVFPPVTTDPGDTPGTPPASGKDNPPNSPLIPGNSNDAENTPSAVNNNSAGSTPSAGKNNQADAPSSASGSSSYTGTAPESVAAVTPETFTGSVLEISGERLQSLIRTNPEFVSFAWQDVNLLLSSEMLAALDLQNDAVFSVKLEKNSLDCFSICITLNGIEITDISGSLIQFLMDDPGAHASLLLDSDPLDTALSYKDGYVSFSVDRTGTYQITAEDAKTAVLPDEQDNMQNQDLNAAGYHFTLLPVIIVVLVILLTSALYFVRKGGTTRA